MSLLKRISLGNSFKSDNILESITEHLHVMFANRTDVYWSYDCKNKKLFGIHEIFKLDMFSSEFLTLLARGIEVFEPRVKNVICSWSVGVEPKLNVQCVLKNDTQTNNLSILLKDL